MNPTLAALAAQLVPDPPWWLKHWAMPVHLSPLPSGRGKRPPAHLAPAHLAGGMSGWQVSLIAVAAALLAAALVVLVIRMAPRGGRYPPAPPEHAPGSGSSRSTPARTVS